MGKEQKEGNISGPKEPRQNPWVVRRMAWAAAAIAGILGAGCGTSGSGVEVGKPDGISTKEVKDLSKRELPTKAGQELDYTLSYINFSVVEGKGKQGRKREQFFTDQLEREWQTTGRFVGSEQQPFRGELPPALCSSDGKDIRGRVLAIQKGKELMYQLSVDGIEFVCVRPGMVVPQKVVHTFLLVPKGTINNVQENAKTLREKAIEKRQKQLEKKEEVVGRRYVKVMSVKERTFIDDCGKTGEVGKTWTLRKGPVPSLTVGISVGGLGNTVEIVREDDLWVLTIGDNEFVRPVEPWGEDPWRPISLLPR